MKLNFHSRAWHRWTSLVLVLPVLIVAVTAITMSHRKSLGTEELTVSANWLPGYRGALAQTGRNEPRASLTTTRGDTYIGTLNGLYRLAGTQLVAVEALAGTQIRGLADAPWGRVAAAKGGIWLEQNGNWQRVLKDDAWSAVSRPDGSVVVALRDKGLVSSNDGRHWQVDARAAMALSSLPSDAAEPVTLARLIMDLHTGKALLGKDGEWVWIDLVGLSLALLALTGAYMWWRTQRRKVVLRGAVSRFPASRS